MSKKWKKKHFEERPVETMEVWYDGKTGVLVEVITSNIGPLKSVKETKN